MKKYHTLRISDISAFFGSADVVSLVTKSDQSKPIFLARMLPVRDDRLFCYSSSSDPAVSVPCTVEQVRYRLADNYKIELVPTVPGFGRQSYYLCDLAQLLRSGEFHVIDQDAGEIPELKGTARAVQQVRDAVKAYRSHLRARPGWKERTRRRFCELFAPTLPLQK